MKNIKIILATLLILFGLGLNSCGDSFLSTDPTVDIPEEEFFTSPERLQSSLMAAYQPLLWHDWGYGQYNPLMILGDIMGEDLNPGGANNKDNEHWHRMNTFTATDELVPTGLWDICFAGVYNSNIVIANKDNITGASESMINEAYGEALTLRAFYYDILWRYWGNLPYYTDNPSAPPYFVEQIDAGKVYERIMEDLDIVIGDDLLPMKTTSVEEYGKVNMATAKMLRAKVVLYQKDESRYATVLQDMKDIIASGVYELYDDFKEMWEVEGEWCSESIFEVNYTDRPSARSWGNPLGTGGSVTPKLIGINQLSGSEEFQTGWGFGTVNTDIYRRYSNLDQRRDGGILNFEQHLKENPNAKYTPRYQDTGLFLRKYLPRIDGNAGATGDKDLNFNNNYRVFRYAETLLLASELLVRTGGSQAEADDYLNQVRARAFEMDVNDAEFVAHKRNATLENILDERRLELFGEGHRFWDLVRFDKAESVLGPKGYTSAKKHLPIPSKEINRAKGTLKQNPY